MPGSSSRSFAIAITLSRSLRSLTPIAIALAASVVCKGAAAQPAVVSAEDVARAEKAYDEGVAATNVGDRASAVAKHRIAYGIVKTPIPGLALANALRDAQALLEARAIAKEVARIADYPNMSPAAAKARADAAELASRIDTELPHLTVKLTGAGASDVTIDGRPVARADLAAPIAVDPGEHTIAVSACPSGVVRLGSGESRSLTWELPATRPGPSEGIGVLPLVGIGVGVVGFGVGSIYGLRAINKKHDLSLACANNKSCPVSQADTLDAMKSAGAISTLAFVVGGLGAGLAVGSLVFRSPPAPVVIPCRGPRPSESPARPDAPTASITVSPFGAWGTF